MDLTNIGRYEIRHEIGRGGMAAVYLAYDPRTRRDVALKLLPPQFLDNPVLRRRFEREALMIAALEHPAIVPVYDFGEQDGQLFLVMRYMHGGSMAARLRSKPMTSENTLKVLSRLAPALDAVHAREIIHRDLKPGNILFDAYDNAYLSDFGIARLAEATTMLTGDAIIGTPAYMSPEQVRGDDELDGRSDIYALGIILFEMLGGRVPFRATTPMAIAMKHITEPAPSIRTLRPEIAPEVEAVLDRALAKSPAERFQSASEMSLALRDALDPRESQMPVQADAVKEEPVLTQPPSDEIATVVETPYAESSEEPALRSAPLEGAPAQTPVLPASQPRIATDSRSSLPTRPEQRRIAPLAVLGGGAALVVLCVIGIAALLAGRFALAQMSAPAAPKETSLVSAPSTQVPAVDVPQGGDTPTPTTLPVSSGPILYEDDFSDPESGWPSGSDASGSLFNYERGKYRIYVNQVDTLYWATPDVDFNDFSIEVEATKVAGPDDNYFGVICRVQDERNYYYMLISSDGYYTMGKYVNGTFNSLLPDGWIYDEAVNRGKTTNRLRVDCVRDTLTFYVNGLKMVSVSDSEFSHGDAGVLAAALEIPGTDIHFDHFIIRQP